MKIEIIKKQNTYNAPVLYIIHINRMYHSIHDTIEDAIIERDKVKAAIELAQKYPTPVVFEVVESYDSK